MSLTKSVKKLSEESDKNDSPSFAKLGLHPTTVAMAQKLGWLKPTAVQQKVIPLVLSGKDVVAVAPSGTGKTGAYSLPLHSLFVTTRTPTEPKRPWAVILVPTRELAMQTAQVLRLIFCGCENHITELIGGLGFSSQRERLLTGVALIVATPGRCENLAQSGDLCLEAVRLWVVDEMDRMLDMGFNRTVLRLLKRGGNTNKGQIILLSATEGHAEKFLRKLHIPKIEYVKISNNNQLPVGLKEEVYLITDSRKIELLEAMLRLWLPHRTLVFLSRREKVENVVKKLKTSGFTSAGLHADLSMTARREALERFTAVKNSILVATDLAGRGLHLPGLELVAHLCVPVTVEEYVHRCGRTARAGTSGRSVLLVSKDDLRDLERLEYKLKRRLPRKLLKGFQYGRESVCLRRVFVSLTGRAIIK